MEKQKELAIILRSVAFEERHKIITAITEKRGLVTAIAKNSVQSRRFGGCLEPFTAAEWQFSEKSGSELLLLLDAQVKRAYEGLRSDFQKFALASAFNELILKLAPQRQECGDLFKLHSNALAILEEMPLTPDGHELIILLNGYLAKLLQWSGSQPQLLGCLSCQISLSEQDMESTVSCLVQRAGWICADCRTTETKHLRASEESWGGFQNSFFRLSPITIRDFYNSLLLPIRQVPEQAMALGSEHRELFKYLEALFIYHIPGFDQHPLRSLRFLGLESTVPLQAEYSR